MISITKKLACNAEEKHFTNGIEWDLCDCFNFKSDNLRYLEERYKQSTMSI
jgi:hypothetical protein